MMKKIGDSKCEPIVEGDDDLTVVTMVRLFEMLP
jgi:hypothetical protein